MAGVQLTPLASGQRAAAGLQPIVSLTRGKSLILGDSIIRGLSDSSTGDGAPLCEGLADLYIVHSARENGRGTTFALTRIAVWLGFGVFDAVLFNFGLHDVSGGEQTTANQYQTNLESLIPTMLGETANVFAINTISVDESLTFPGHNAAIDAHNVRLQTVATAQSIDLIDINTFTKNNPTLEAQRSGDGVHYSDAGYIILATEVDRVLRTFL